MVQTNSITHIGAGLSCGATRQLSLLNNTLLPKGMALPTLSSSVLSAQSSPSPGTSSWGCSQKQ